MPPISPPLPELAALPRLLERVTEALAHELARPGTAQPADWNVAEWSLARAVAVMHGIGPLLALRGTWPGGGGWQAFLQTQRTHTARRHERLVHTLGLVDRDARDAGVALIALKGMELHRLGIYRPGERPMADIDLLAGIHDVEAAASLLERLGFRGGAVGWKDQLFVADTRGALPTFGEHADNPVKIELHRHIVERLPWRLVSLPVRLLPDSPCSGVVPYPSRGTLMLHLLLHAAGTMPTRTLRLMHLHDIAALAATLSAEDWRVVLASRRAQDAWWRYPPLRLAARYYDTAIPAMVLQGVRALCPSRLARWADGLNLFEASHSYPWVEALPGIGWSRSLAERIAYVANRIRPGPEMRARRAVLADSEAWTDPDWSRRSQWRRILRFVSGKQARPSTMHAVRMAFEVGG